MSWMMDLSKDQQTSSFITGTWTFLWRLTVLSFVVGEWGSNPRKERSGKSTLLLATTTMSLSLLLFWILMELWVQAMVREQSVQIVERLG